jgi:hypothetical protein
MLGGLQGIGAASRRSISMAGVEIPVNQKMAHKPNYLKPSDSIAEILT